MASKIESAEYTELNRVIGWFIVLRWVAFAGVAVSLAAVRLTRLYDLPFALLFAVTGLLGLLNLSFTAWFRLWKRGNLSRRETAGFFHAQVVCDYTLLFFLVYFTGFLENPFCYFFVFHILLTALIFNSRVVYAYVGALVALVAGAFLAEYLTIVPHYGLLAPSADPYLRQNLPRAVGLVSILLISAYLVTSIKRRLEEQGQRCEVELDRYRNLDKIKSNFILQVTHELRGPIAAVSGYHEMMLRGIGGQCPPKALDIVRKADHRTDNLLTIIDEMIDYAYMKSQGEVRPARSRLALRGVIEENLELLETQAAGQTDHPGRQLPEGPGRAGHPRPAEDHPGQPGAQRHQVLPAPHHGQRDRAGRRAGGAPPGPGRGLRHRGGGAGEDLRGVLPHPGGARAGARRHRPGTVDRQAGGGVTGRPDHRVFGSWARGPPSIFSYLCRRPRMSKILIIDDDLDIQETMGALLEAEGFQIRSAETVEKGLEMIGSARRRTWSCWT